MRSHIRKWGNSLAIRIPWAIAREIGLARDAEVDIGARDGSLVATPVAPPLAGAAPSAVVAEVKRKLGALIFAAPAATGGALEQP